MIIEIRQSSFMGIVCKNYAIRNQLQVVYYKSSIGPQRETRCWGKKISYEEDPKSKIVVIANNFFPKVILQN